MPIHYTPHLEMLTSCHTDMDKELFDKLSKSTNAVESHNRLSKKRDPDILKVALIATHRIDMASALEHIAASKGNTSSYVDMSTAAREQQANIANKARACKRLKDNDSEGPPDKHGDFCKGTCMY